MRSDRAALLVLALLLVSGVGALVASPRARVRWYAWRMHSSDAEVAARARFKLFELDRPAIDEVLPELVARELAARVGSEWCLRVGTLDKLVFDSNGEVSQPFTVQPRDPAALLLRKRVRRAALYLEWIGPRPRFFDALPPSPIAIPLDEDLAPEILSAVRAELGARAP